MVRRSWILVLCVAVSFALGWLSGGGGASPSLGVSPAYAGGPLEVGSSATFVSTDGGNAYLWRRDGDRLVLLNQCMRIQGAAEGQATYVSLPGVERGS
jgi:hypothetical protein